MENKVKGKSYLDFALYAFAGLGLEIILISFIDPIFGIKPQSIMHWVITSIIWLVVGLVLISVAKKKVDFDLFENKTKLKGLQYIGIIICFIVSIILSYIGWEGFKPFLEFQRLGLAKFIFQYIYYIFESFMMSLIIVFGQKACEKWFKTIKFLMAA